LNKFKLELPKKSIWYLIICGGIIVIFISAGIVPLYRYNSALNKDIQKLEEQIKEQKKLQIAYSSLINLKGKSDLRNLPNPLRTTIPRQEALKFQDIFKETALKSGLKPVSLTPEFNTLAGPSNLLSHTAIVKGEFHNFRKLLIKLGNISYLDRIEELRIEQNSDSMEMGMKIWITLGS